MEGVAVREAPGRKRFAHLLGQPLTQREVDVLQLFAQGYALKDIAHFQRLSIHTIHTRRSCIYAKLGATTRVEAVVLGYRQGYLLDLGTVADEPPEVIPGRRPAAPKPELPVAAEQRRNRRRARHAERLAVEARDLEPHLRRALAELKQLTGRRISAHANSILFRTVQLVQELGQLDQEER